MYYVKDMETDVVMAKADSKEEAERLRQQLIEEGINEGQLYGDYYIEEEEDA